MKAWTRNGRLGQALLVAAIAGGLAGGAAAQQFQSAEDTAADTCRTGLGDVAGILQSEENVSAGVRSAVEADLETARSAEAREDWSGCLDALESALARLDRTDG